MHQKHVSLLFEKLELYALHICAVVIALLVRRNFAVSRNASSGCFQVIGMKVTESVLRQ